MSQKFIFASASTKSDIKHEGGIWGVSKSCDYPWHLSWSWLLGPYSGYFIVSSSSSIKGDTFDPWTYSSCPKEWKELHLCLLPFPVQQGRPACCLPGCSWLLGNSQDAGVILFLSVIQLFLLLSYDNSSQSTLCNLYKAVFFCPFVLLEKVLGTRAFVQVSWYSGIQMHHDLCERCLIISQ